MKQKNKIDILYEARFMNLCLQGHSCGSQIFMIELKTSKNSMFSKSAGTNSQILV